MTHDAPHLLGKASVSESKDILCETGIDVEFDIVCRSAVRKQSLGRRVREFAHGNFLRVVPGRLSADDVARVTRHKRLEGVDVHHCYIVDVGCGVGDRS